MVSMESLPSCLSNLKLIPVRARLNPAAAPQVGSALYETLCPFLVDNFSQHVGDELKKSVSSRRSSLSAYLQPEVTWRALEERERKKTRRS